MTPKDVVVPGKRRRRETRDRLLENTENDPGLAAHHARHLKPRRTLASLGGAAARVLRSTRDDNLISGLAGMTPHSH